MKYNLQQLIMSIKLVGVAVSGPLPGKFCDNIHSPFFLVPIIHLSICYYPNFAPPPPPNLCKNLIQYRILEVTLFNAILWRYRFSLHNFGGITLFNTEFWRWLYSMEGTMQVYGDNVIQCNCMEVTLIINTNL